MADPVFWVGPVFDDDGVQVSSGIGEDGKEYPDPVPMAPPVGFVRPPDILRTIRELLESERLRMAADAEGFDTPEEADDFELEEAPEDALTEYEKHFLPNPEVVKQVEAAKEPSQTRAPEPLKEEVKEVKKDSTHLT